MAGLSTDPNKLDTEEGQKKAETLFSKKFIEYLSNKRSPGVEKPLSTSPTRDLLRERGSSVTSSSDETSCSESSRKSHRKTKKKLNDHVPYSYINFNYAVRNKLTQCSLIKDAEEIVPPEELKTLLTNMTILLQEFKQCKVSFVGFESLNNLITKVTTLMMEFIRRPIKRIEQDKLDDYSKNLSQTSEKILNLLKESKDGTGSEEEGVIREYKRMEKELVWTDQQIAEVKRNLLQNGIASERKPSDMEVRVRKSILDNERLKAEIKFNQTAVKKYKKLLIEREWTKHKLETEMNHLRKKMSIGDLSDTESLDKRPPSPEQSLESDSPQSSPRKLKTPKVKKGKEKIKTLGK